MQQPNNKLDNHLPKLTRISIGSAIVLGLLEGKLDAEPTTAYLMTYKTDKCTANCSFCPQARTSQSKAELLSRISWPAFPTKRVIIAIENAFNNRRIKRVCIQALHYPNVFQHLTALIKAIKQHTKFPISISCQPLNNENIHRLAKAGANRIAIPIDTATQKLFDKVKGLAANGPYIWQNQFKQLREAVRIFGKENVSTHLIIGLGETEKEAVHIIQQCIDMNVLPALFAFTPIRGTALENNFPPEMKAYRQIQLARHLIINGITRYENMHFHSNGKIEDFNTKKETLKHIIETGQPFLTSGCPDCNRPFYNEKPSGPIYNYPRNIRPNEIATIKQQLNLED